MDRWRWGALAGGKGQERLKISPWRGMSKKERRGVVARWWLGSLGRCAGTSFDLEYEPHVCIFQQHYICCWEQLHHIQPRRAYFVQHLFEHKRRPLLHHKLDPRARFRPRSNRSGTLHLLWDFSQHWRRQPPSQPCRTTQHRADCGASPGVLQRESVSWLCV